MEGDLRLGYVSLLSLRYLPRLLGAAAMELPGLRVRLHQDSSAGVADMVLTGSLDLGFVRDLSAVPAELVTSVFARERVMAALPTGHPLAGAEALDLAELRDEQFVLPTQSALPALRGQIHHVCEAAGFTPAVRASADDLTGLLSYVASGLCVSLLTEALLDLPVPGITYVRCAERRGAWRAPSRPSTDRTRTRPYDECWTWPPSCTAVDDRARPAGAPLIAEHRRSPPAREPPGPPGPFGTTRHHPAPTAGLGVGTPEKRRRHTAPPKRGGGRMPFLPLPPTVTSERPRAKVAEQTGQANRRMRGAAHARRGTAVDTHRAHRRRHTPAGAPHPGSAQHPGKGRRSRRRLS
ncbi:LysR family substrate-binding domain-containing protein [Streptomyces griseofuscus]|uniref:LysR family substrate-binding domain-containing protein n=1 Tax=Streptomyces griseofuscus TaxID=146922 RepID=UPI003BA9E581